MLNNSVRKAKSTRTLREEIIAHPLYKTYDVYTANTLIHIKDIVDYRDIVKQLKMSQENMTKLVKCSLRKMNDVYSKLIEDGWLKLVEKRPGKSDIYIFDIPRICIPDSSDMHTMHSQICTPCIQTSNKQEETNGPVGPSQNVPFDPYRDKSLKLLEDGLDETNTKLDTEDNISHDFSKQSMTCDDFLKQINGRKSDMVIHLQGKQYYDY